VTYSDHLVAAVSDGPSSRGCVSKRHTRGERLPIREFGVGFVKRWHEIETWSQISF
jgi:hypothetical protein